MKHINYKMNAKITAEDFSDVFKRSGIVRPVEDLTRLQQMLDHASITFTAWEGDKLVGIARSVTDFSYCCYLSDLAVDREYQKQGIGKELVRLTKEKIGDEVTLLLLSAPSAMEYYPKIGFEKIENGFRIQRKR
nr:GNAT family N-acetyltransferase [Neobacillus sp. Marseille-Q6967]